MIKIENIEVFNFEGAIRGLRNPHNSWHKSDSKYGCVTCTDCDVCMKKFGCSNYKHSFNIGQADIELMQKLYKGGSEHRKFARQIFVSMDITSNHFWWSEFDTYKVGVCRDSCSKMHTIHIKSFDADDFSHEGIYAVGGTTKAHFHNTIEELENLRQMFNETKERRYWRAILELLPMGYNIKATVTMNYENVFNIIKQREGHKLDEWRELVDRLKELPYVREIMGREENNADEMLIKATLVEYAPIEELADYVAKRDKTKGVW